jgi:carbon monoxide dehydrogenase subunit G
MQLSQRVEIPVARESVWLALNDHRILMQCLPGCEQFEPSEENCFTIVLLAKVGPVKARFQGQVELSDIQHATSYVLSGAGKGGVAGFAKGSASVQLADVEGSEGATVLTYAVNSSVGGKLAQVGSRLVRGAASKMANEFFTRFVGVVTNNPEQEVLIETIES